MSTISVRIDDNTKSNVEKLFSSMGLTVSAATNLFYHQVLNYGKLPFEVIASVPNPKLQEAIREAYDIADGESDSPSFTNVSELMLDLNS